MQNPTLRSTPLPLLRTTVLEESLKSCFAFEFRVNLACACVKGRTALMRVSRCGSQKCLKCVQIRSKRCPKCVKIGIRRCPRKLPRASRSFQELPGGVPGGVPRGGSSGFQGVPGGSKRFQRVPGVSTIWITISLISGLKCSTCLATRPSARLDTRISACLDTRTSAFRDLTNKKLTHAEARFGLEF